MERLEDMTPWIRIETAFQVNIQERQGARPWPCSSVADRIVESKRNDLKTLDTRYFVTRENLILMLFE